MVQFLGLKTRQHIIVFCYRNLENGEMKPPCGQNFMWPVFKKKNHCLRLNTKARLRMDFRSEYKGVTRDGLTLSLVCRNSNDPTHATNG